MENWNTLFREHILERGYQYFKLGVVTDVRKTTDGYTTIVEGTEKYAVEIDEYIEKRIMMVRLHY